MIVANTIGFIGAGNMGQAIIAGLIKQGCDASQIYVLEKHPEKIASLQSFGALQRAASYEQLHVCETLVLAVKPQGIKSLCQQLSPYLTSRHLVISIAAGITCEQLQTWLATDCALIRAMPNTPALIAQGITALYTQPETPNEHREKAESLLGSIGDVLWIDDESLMNVITALCGSGPAYFFYFMEGLITAATKMGLSKEDAVKLTYKTAIGSVLLAQQSPDSVERLRLKVTSKGGTTEKGIMALKDGKMHEILEQALKQAALQGKILSEQFQ